MYRRLKSPLTVQVEMTEQCNSSCLHCYNHWRTGKTRNWLNSSNIEHIVEELSVNEVFDVTITGGEPLIQPKETILMVERLQDAKINFSMNSNLRLLTPDMAAKLRIGGLRTILTSFVSHDRRHHEQITQSETSYDQVVKGIRVAREHGFKVAANMVISKINLADLRETALFLLELGVTSFCATKTSPPSDLRNVQHLLLNKEEVIQSLTTLVDMELELGISVDILECYPLCLIRDGKKFSKFFRRSCVAGISSCTIGSNGAVRPCSHASQEYGNILTESLGEIWMRMDDWRDGSYLPEKCKNCGHLRVCTGGCRIDAYAHGDIGGMDPCSEPELCDDIVYPDRLPIQEGVKYQLPLFNSRKEDFGCAIYSQKACFPVNDTGFQILEKLRFTSFYLYDFDEEQRDFLHHLIRLGFVSPVINKENEP